MGLRMRLYYAPIVIAIVGFGFVVLNFYRSETEYHQIASSSTSSQGKKLTKRILTRSREKLNVDIKSEYRQDDIVDVHQVNVTADDGYDDSVATSDVDDSKEYLENVNASSQPITQSYNFEEVQADRKSYLNAACNRLGITRALPSVSWATTVHFIISDKFQFLFCFVPKIACTTWKDVMIQVYHNQVGKTKKRFVKLDEFKQPDQVIKRWTGYRKVVFVREPLARVLSAYLNKFRYGEEKRAWERRFGPQIAKKTRTGQTKGPYKDFTFEEFIRFILDLGPGITMDQMKDHWLPYSTFTSPCQIKYDYIGHYETLAHDGPAIVEKLGIKDVVHFPEIHGSTAVDSLQKEYAKVPVDLILKLQEYYGMDYEIFGYSKEESLKLALGGRSAPVRSH